MILGSAPVSRAGESVSLSRTFLQDCFGGTAKRTHERCALLRYCGYRLAENGQGLLDVSRDVELGRTFDDRRSCGAAERFVRPEFYPPRQRGDVVWSIDN